MKSLWIPAKIFVVAALLLSSAAVLIAGDGDCNNNGSKNPSCTCRNLSSTEADRFDTDIFCSQPKYYVPPTFPKFTAQPTSKIRDPTSDDPVTLNCEISLNAASFSIIWEHNGVPINNSSMYSGYIDSSTLTIERPSLVESEGRYRCRMNYQYGNFSLVSREAYFETPRFSGWVDSISGNATPIMSNTTILAVQEGESFILECNPRTNDPSISDVSAIWTRDRVLIDSDDDGIIFLGGRNSTLLVRNFSSGGENVNVTFQCLFSGLRHLEELERTFVITPVKGQASQDFLVPQNQTVLPGATVNLYCLSKSESSMNYNNTWLFRNVTINQVSHSNHYDIVGGGRVLMIRNVSMETIGVYTCHTVSGEEYSAFVEVLDNIVIESTSHSFTSGAQISIDTGASAATSHTISLSCRQLNGSDYSNLNFEWFFRGRPINSSYTYSSSLNSGSQNHAAVTFIEQENVLTMISEDPWQLIGTVQCFVSIASPTDADQLHEMKSANVHILARGKPNPPCFITMNRMFNMHWPFKYQLTYYNDNYCPPQARGTTYVTEILIQHNSNKKLYTCQKGDGYLNFDTTDTDLLSTNKKKISFRVAVNVGGVLSDFLPFVNQATNSCEVSLVVDRPPPTPTFHGSAKFKLSSQNPYQWNVTQEWNTTNECVYPSSLYDTYTSLSCPGHEEYNHSKALAQKHREFFYTVPCRMTCSLTISVEVYTDSQPYTYANHNTTTITTPPIAPAEPPALYGVKRVNETSFDVNVTLVNKIFSCVEELPYLVVNYTSPGGNSSAVSINIENCTRLIGRDTNTTSSYTCHVTDKESCLDTHIYDVRVAYESIIDDEVHISHYSNVLQLQGPSEESILAGIQSMNAIATSTNEITVNFSISENITCIVQRERLIIAQICYANTTCESADHEFVPTNCQNQAVGESEVKFQDLLADSTYCIRANISYGNANHVFPDYTLYTHTTTTVERKGSTTSGVNQDQTVLKAIVGAAAGAVAVLCALVACIFFMSCCYYRRTKIMRNYHRLNDNDSITSRDPVDPAERAESVHSDGTDPGFLVRRLMKDIEGQPDGDEDHQIICEDDAGHQGDGKFEDVERESLQGFGDAEEMAENESSSVKSSSLEDRQKMKTMLSNIRKENQAYQASKKQEVTVELSPLRSPPSLASPSSNGVPPSNCQRTVPDGYVEDQNVNVISEGFHNPVCTPSLLVSVAGGPVPPRTSTLTNQIPAHNGHVTSHVNRPHLQLKQQQPLPTASHGYRTSGTASSTPMQPSGNRSQTMMLRTESSVAAPSNGGYVQSSQLPDIQLIPHQPFAVGDNSFNLIDLSSNDENTAQNLSLQPPLNLSADGYVQESASMTSGGDSGTLNLNAQPSLGANAHILSPDGYAQDPTPMSGGGEERGLSVESGNEDDSLSNEEDSNSVFDDELIPSKNSVHSMRPRSTVTSGFQSGSSESASSPEPPKKSISSTSSLLSSVSTVLPPSTLNVHASMARKEDDISPCLTNHSLKLQPTPSNNLSSDSFLPHTPHSRSSSSIPPTSDTESTFITPAPAYRPSSTGGSSGYVTNESSQSYTYHSSSATSQTSQTSALAPSDLEQELNLGGVESHQKYTIPSLLSCNSKSSSPAISHSGASDWTTNDTSTIQTDSSSARRLPHYSHHHQQATNAIVMDYVNTRDVDLNIISTDLSGLCQMSEKMDDVSFEFNTVNST